MPVKAPACLDKVYALLSRTGMLHANEPVLAAVSGGPDSICLLHVLLEHNFKVEVAHVDHQTRNGASAEDAAFVKALCDALNIPFHSISVPVAEEAAKHKMSFEQYARDVRYRFFIKTARECGCEAIATGHHAGDQAETVLMRMVRGTTPRGISGIAPVQTREGRRIVRPLLDCTRDDIVAFLEERGYGYRIDASNSDPKFLRNRVRHELLPLLKSGYNQRIEDALERLADSQRCENALLESFTEALLEQCVDGTGSIVRNTFRMAHESLQRRAVVEFALARGVLCSFDLIVEAARFIATGRTGEKLDLGGLVLRNARSVTEVQAANQKASVDVVPLDCPGETVAFGRRFSLRELDAPPVQSLREHCSPTRQVFDAAVLANPLTLRTRRLGDRFTPFGMRGSKKVKEYFIELGFSLRQKNTTPLFRSGESILWVVGYSISEAGAVHASTKRCIELTVETSTSEFGSDDDAPE
jgi:tRNA(Ile)-lysidine synthase